MVEELNSIKAVVDGLLAIRNELMLSNGDITPEIAKTLAIKYWSLSSSFTDCILSIDKVYRMYVKKSKERYSEVMLNSDEKTEAGRKRIADSDALYLEYENAVAEITDYRNFVLRVKDDVDSAHKLFKTIYQKEVELFLGTPKVEE